MDEVVFLSVLSAALNPYRSASYLYLWGYQFVVLTKGKATGTYADRQYRIRQAAATIGFSVSSKTLVFILEMSEVPIISIL